MNRSWEGTQPRGGLQQDKDVADGSGWMLSSAVAEFLGVRTATLNKWRARGKGPQVWCRTSPTTLHYLRSSVLEFERGWRENTSNFGGGQTRTGGTTNAN